MVGEIEPIGKCDLKTPLPDYSGAKPDNAVRAYRVEMRVDYEPGDHPIVFLVENSGKELRPWQAYASFRLTGGFVALRILRRRVCRWQSLRNAAG